MFSFYNLLHCNYWISPAANYVFGSILSYFLNKHFTFKNIEKGWKLIGRFVINIVICYIIAYGIAKPFARWILDECSYKMQENGAMLIGMFIFVILNYLGQRFFAFK